MKKLYSLLTLLVLLAPMQLSAQSIDFGRGELPITVPDSYSADNPTPLIVLLHGYTSSGRGQDMYLGFSRVADRYNFLFVAPDGTQETSDRQNRFWNATDACCNFFNSEVDDSGYIIGIINKMKEEYNVDPNRVYLVGHSNGGFMSYQMAYRHSDSIAAIASLAGATHLEDRDAPANPVHILQIHGTDDTTIEYGGGDIQGNVYPSAMETVTQWADYNGCSTEGAERELRDLESNLEGHESSVLLFELGCAAGGSSELWTIQNGSHVPRVSESFSAQVVEWLYAHPKEFASYAD
ncbi:MAG: prolyl oligopeptidase family serine peptidase [Gammaproteobacteria bacterium]|nr:prolyl oligopeptidase family serine peptidase [Gammaproteobacteria bacterium]MDD9895552.1 prolyl oligopeptidase family serine peptidase [Gammaproteobacteria bacterium]MDD9958462.1 prolyl oligopeptidase family serine peptidase [Gammaproteobacteria bacterium]